MAEEREMSQQELVGKCFLYLNSFKRHRALANIRRLEGDMQTANHHELKTYQLVDSLELGLRALQKGMRDIGEEAVE